MDRLQIVKIGGNVIDDAAQLASFLRAFHTVDTPKILVHGGGKHATQLSQQLGLNPVLIDGRRVTSDADLEIAVMVYAGQINTQIVATLQGMGCNAIGLSGADGNTIRSVKRPVGTIDFGWVGDVQQVNAELLKLLINHDLTPVLCAITHDQHGQLLNTNADTIAAEVASAMSKLYDVELVYCFEKNGVLRDVLDPDSIITDIDTERYAELKATGILHNGMIPKLENCFHALKNAVTQVVITHAIHFNDPTKPCTRITL